MTLKEYLSSGAKKYIESGTDIPHDTLKEYLEKDIVTMKDGKIVMFEGRDRRVYDKAKQKETDKLLKESERFQVLWVKGHRKYQNKKAAKLERALAKDRRANARRQRILARKQKRAQRKHKGV